MNNSESLLEDLIKLFLEKSDVATQLISPNYDIIYNKGQNQQLQTDLVYIQVRFLFRYGLHLLSLALPNFVSVDSKLRELFLNRMIFFQEFTAKQAGPENPPPTNMLYDLKKKFGNLGESYHE